MTKRAPKNIAASIRQRLLNAAQASGRPFQELLQYFAMERFLYRLAQSKHAERFVLKGALMFNVWQTPSTRPTKDIDLLGRMPNDIAAVADVVRDVCREPVEADGLTFDADSVTGLVIKEDADYEGVRVTFRGALENVPIPMQIDVGFGDVVFPAPTTADYPTILDHAAPRLRIYPRETVVAEKFEAMVKLGLLNSRMKDFHDIWLLARQFAFDGADLAAALRQTFAHRGTPLTADPTALRPEFAADATKQAQWAAFLRKSRLENAPADLAEVTRAIAEFLSAPAAAVVADRPFTQTWPAGGTWQG